MLLSTLCTPVLAPALLESSQARSGKTTICHRTNSIQNPYRRITVSKSSLNSGHKGHTGSIWTISSTQGGTKWGDVIPDASAGGSNSTELNFTGNTAGQNIWRGLSINSRTGSPVCKTMTMKAFYDSEKAAGQSDANIVAELKDAEADEDLLLLQTLNLTFNTLTTTNLVTVTTASQAIVVSTLAPTSVGVSTATLNGSVKTDGTALTCHFEYDTSSGFATSTLNPSTATSVTLNTTSSRTVSLTGLAATTKYYYRLVCHDTGGGDLYGETVSFTTGTTYTITYDSNTAISGSVPTDYTLYASSESASIRGNENSLVKTGYSFSGWTELANGSGTVYSPSNTTTIAMSQDRVLYAKWTATTFPVLFDSNTATSGTISNQTFTAGTSQALTSNSFAKTGYTFNGWNTVANGSGTSYTNAQSVTLYETTTAYAQWTAGTYAVTFDSNTAGSGTMSNQSLTAGTPFSLTSNGFTKTGYIFAGWATSSGGSVVYTNAQSITLYAATTLYAKWTANTYAVTFNINSGTSGSMSTQSFTAGTPFALTTNGFSRTGYTFAGWATSSAGSVVYTNTQSATLYAATTLYAKWTAITYTITYNANTATSGAVPASGSYTTDGTAYPVVGNTGSLVLSGNTFSGWNSQADGLGITYTAYSTSADITLYAIWTNNSTYRIDYSGNGNTGGSTPASQSVATGSPINVQSNSGSLVRTGYTFLGWYSNSLGTGGTPYTPGVTSVTPSGNTTLYANWSATSFPVDFDSNTATTGTMSSQTFTAGTGQVLSANTFAKTGYTFSNWNTAANGSGSTYADLANLTLYATTTFYALWSANSFPVTFDSNTATSGSMSNLTYTAGSAQALSANAFSKTGFTFAGWATTSSSSVVFSDLQSITLYETTTVYAKWTGNNLIVKFYPNSGAGTMSDQTIVAGTGTAITTSTFTYSGNSFTGWNTVAGGTGTSYNDAEIVTIITDMDLYAQWSSTPTFSVTYTAGGGSGTVPTQSALVAGATFVTGSGAGLTRSGYTFAGWSCNSGSTISAGTSVTMTAAAMTCVAQWTANSSGNGNSNNTPAASANSSKTTPAAIRKSSTVSLVTIATTPVKATAITVTTAPVTIPTAPGNSGSTPATGSGTTTAPGNSESTPATGSGTTTAPGNSGSTPATGSGTTTAPGNSGSTPAPVNAVNRVLSQTTIMQSTGTEAITFTGAGVSKVTVVNQEVSIQAKRGFSGKTTLKITVTSDVEVKKITADVWVLPFPVTNPVVKVLVDEKTRVQWIRSPNAISYEVIQNGKVLCVTPSVSCTLATMIPAEPAVQIKALGRDNSESNQIEAKYIAAATTRVIPDIALVINFDTAKYNLDAGDKALIRGFAANVVKYGYTKVDITGHTDSRGGIDNNLLSDNRAKAARDYLVSLLPTLKVTVNGYADAINVASNTTAEGMAANRRAEFRVVS